MQNFLTIFFIFLTTTTYAKSIDRGGADLLNAKAYSGQLDSSVFLMTGHYDDYGVFVAKNEGSSYRLIDNDLKISYGLSSNLETSILARFRSINSSDGTVDAKNSGVESAGIVVKYAFTPMHSLKYALGLHYRQTLYTNTVYPTSQIPPLDEVILGDDGSEYGVDLYGTYTSNPWRIDFKIGYNSPPNDLSSEILYNLESSYKFTKFGLFAGIEGINSLKKDHYTDTPTLKPLMSIGQSSLFNSLNREKTAPYLGANYQFSKYLLALKAQTILSGKSTDKGNTISASFVWSSEGVTAESVKIDSFKEYIIDGSVLKVSARGNYIKIDQGLSTDVEKGLKFDIYQTDYFGGNILVASGIVYEIGSDWSIIKVLKKYQEIEIKPGFAARGY